MRLVLISNLYPNPSEPFRATYNRRLFKAIARKIGNTSLSVIGTIYWCPLIDSLLRKRRKPPVATTLDGIEISHPRVFYTPGFLIHKHHHFYRAALRKNLSRLAHKDKTNTHIIIGFAYPDGVAIAPLCKELGLSYSIMVLGSDFRVRIKQPKFRGMVLDCLKEATTIFCPGNALKDDMAEAGINRDSIYAFNNGVEHEIFRFEEKTTASAVEEAESQPNSILFVGNLLDVKAPQRLLKAFRIFVESKRSEQISNSQILQLRLDIVGDGPLRMHLEKLAKDLGIAEQVVFHGRITPERIAEMMQQAKCLCLCSRSEGMPNVVVEALACGCPVVATSVGEVPFLIEEGLNGYLVPIQQDEAKIVDNLAHDMECVFKQTWNRKLISHRMKDYSWETAADVVLKAIATKP